MANGKMEKDGTYYDKNDLIGKTPKQVRRTIKKFLNDPDQLGCAAFDLIHAINKWLKPMTRKVSIENTPYYSSK